MAQEDRIESGDASSITLPAITQPQVTKETQSSETQTPIGERSNEKGVADKIKGSDQVKVTTEEYDELSGNNETVFDAAGEPIVVTGYDVSRYIVSTRDDGDPPLTFRCIVLGSLFSLLASTIHMIYTFKPAQAGVSGLFLQIVVWIFGQAWARFTPSPERFKSATVQRVLRFLNSGQPFLIKEHVIAALISGASSNAQAGIEIFAVERLYYNKNTDVLTALLGTFSVTTIGFVLAGFMRPLIVYPSEMVFWGTLPQVVLYQNLHHDMKNNRERVIKFTRWFSLAFLWEVVPAWIAPMASGLSVFCLASLRAPKDTQQVMTNVFGGAGSNEGLGLGNISLDWQYIQSGFLSLPFKQQANSWIGLAIGFIVMPALYYGNAWGAKSLPFMSTDLFTQDGRHFKLLSVIGDDFKVDRAKLAEVGLPRMTATTLWGFFTQNCAIGALITHVLLFYGSSVIKTLKHTRAGTLQDPHYQAMRKYKEVPFWWYGLVFSLSILAGVIVNAKGTTTLPVWGLFVALALGFFIAPFSAILLGLFGNSVATNGLSKMVAGIVHPASPLANLWFAAFSHQIVVLGLNLSNWLKIGQYTKVPHRVLFLAQMYASLLGAFFSYVIMATIVSREKPLLLNANQGDHTWSAAHIGGVNTASITWAMARDVYSLKGPYGIVPLGLLIGAGAPLLHFFVMKALKRFKERKGRNQGVHNRNAVSPSRFPIAAPIIIAYSGAYHSGITSQMMSTILVGVLSQYVMRTRRARWFNRWNYLLGAALDGGSETMIFVLSFAVLGAGGKAVRFPRWFGNLDQDKDGQYPDHCTVF